MITDFVEKHYSPLFIGALLISFSLCCQSVSAKGEVVNGHEAVDLGLSVKWASCNVGADSPEEGGNYYSWAETMTKDDYGANVTAYKEGGKIAAGDISGSKYDAATKEWGEKWRMPNVEEAEELVKKCTWAPQSVNGIKGFKVTGPNGNSIFLPACGYMEDDGKLDQGNRGLFWTSTRCIVSQRDAFRITCKVDPKDPKFVVGPYYRTSGLSIRPVTGAGISDDNSFLNNKSGTHNDHDYVDLGLSVKWATCNIGAKAPAQYGGYYARGDARMNKRKFSDANYKHDNKNIDREVKELSGSKYDVATLRWGGNWRTPTEEEAQELITKCKWEPVRVNGHYGHKITGPNGNSIFLPAAGYIDFNGYPNSSHEGWGRYWTTGVPYLSNRGRELVFNSLKDEKKIDEEVEGYMGLTIRPVL